MAWIVLLLLTILGALAALGLTLRYQPHGRAEGAVTATSFFFALIVLPIYILGYAEALTAPRLGGLSFAIFGLTLFLSAGPTTVRAHAGAALRYGRDLLALPYYGLREALRARSLAALSVALSLAIILLALVFTILAPSESWDGMFYHEPIIGFAIQNQGFGVLRLNESAVVQAVNGYPKFCETFALWFVIFTDKSLIEIGNVLAAPALVLAAYGLIIRHSRDRVTAMGWASWLLMIPCMLTQIRTTMIDVQITFLMLAGIGLATRPTYRLRDAALTSLVLTMLVATKSSGPVWALPVALVAAARLIWTHRSKGVRMRALGVAVGGTVLISGTAAVTLVRNWLYFKNPLWPVTFPIPSLGIHWQGLADKKSLLGDISFADVLHRKYAAPMGASGDIVLRDYGYGVPWVVVPLTGVALVLVVLAAVRGRVLRRPDQGAERVAALALLGVIFLLLTPALNIARYNVHIIVLAVVCIAWAGAQVPLGGARVREGMLAATLAVSLVPYAWTDWFFGLEPTARLGFRNLLRNSASNRASLNMATFQMPVFLARMRERNVKKGDLVVYSDGLDMPGVLWNHEFSNRVAYVPSKDPRAFVAALEAMRPVWVVVGASGPGRQVLDARRSEWVYLGPANSVDYSRVYGRVGAPPPE